MTTVGMAASQSLKLSQKEKVARVRIFSILKTVAKTHLLLYDDRQFLEHQPRTGRLASEVAIVLAEAVNEGGYPLSDYLSVIEDDLTHCKGFWESYWLLGDSIRICFSLPSSENMLRGHLDDIEQLPSATVITRPERTKMLTWITSSSKLTWGECACILASKQTLTPESAKWAANFLRKASSRAEDSKQKLFWQMITRVCKKRYAIQ